MEPRDGTAFRSKIFIRPGGGVIGHPCPMPRHASRMPASALGVPGCSACPAAGKLDPERRFGCAPKVFKSLRSRGFHEHHSMPRMSGC